MSDTLITVVAIILVAGLIFVVPLMTMADRVDTTSQAEVESIVTDFVEEIRTTGKITKENYNKFLENLSATGYIFDVEMQTKIADKDYIKTSSQVSQDKIGENVYYSEYTSQIEEELEKSGVKKLKTGYMVLVTVKNTDLTLAQQLKSFAYKIVGNDTATVVASKAGMVQ